MDREVDKLISKLRRKSSVRRAAEAVLADKPLASEAITALNATLALPLGKRWMEQVVAVWALSQTKLPDQDRAAATARLHEVLAARPGRSLGWMVFWCYAYFIGFPWVMYTSIVDGRKNRVRAAAATALVNLGTSTDEDTQATAAALVEAILEMPKRTASHDKLVRIAAAQGLCSILRSLPRRHQVDIPPKLVSALMRLLKDPKEEIVVTVLEALRLVDDPKALPSVERIAQKHKSAQVRAVASQACESLKVARTNASLLRPASAPCDDVDLLLRPASVGGETPSELLLRPAEYTISESE